MPSSATTPRTAPPRWAGYVAAAFGLEYVIAKVVMAARGKLGVPGHPAPPEAYERFAGDVVTAQLGNAALGLVTVAIALALVQRWGRRVPAPVLALGAGAALVGGIAGAFTVAASLTGLREDHGQWGVDSLVLGVAPLGAWLVLTLAAIRTARAEGFGPWARTVRARAARLLTAAPRVERLGSWARTVRERTGRLIGAVTRPGRRAALVAATACAAYGGLKLHWALGGELLLRQTPLPADAVRDMLEREPGTVASHWASVALALVGIALAVATVRAPGLPRLLRVGLPALIGGLMLVRAGVGAAGDVAVLTGATDGSERFARWDLGLWAPFFAAWGTAWVLAAARAARLASWKTPKAGRIC